MATRPRRRAAWESSPSSSKPMQTMRLEYADAALIEQLLAATEQRAKLMAIACHEILAQLRADQRMITSEDVQRSLEFISIYGSLCL
jgi:hypothetical protein